MALKTKSWIFIPHQLPREYYFCPEWPFYSDFVFDLLTYGLWGMAGFHRINEQSEVYVDQVTEIIWYTERYDISPISGHLTWLN